MVWLIIPKGHLIKTELFCLSTLTHNKCPWVCYLLGFTAAQLISPLAAVTHIGFCVHRSWSRIRSYKVGHRGTQYIQNTTKTPFFQQYPKLLHLILTVLRPLIYTIELFGFNKNKHFHVLLPQDMQCGFCKWCYYSRTLGLHFVFA